MDEKVRSSNQGQSCEGEQTLAAWFHAAFSGDIAELMRHIEDGIWTEARSEIEAMTALMIAACEGHLDAVKYLAQEVSLDEKDPWGNTAALWAAASGHIEILDLLQEKGASMSVKNKSGLDIEAALNRAALRARTPKNLTKVWDDCRSQPVQKDNR